MVSPSRRSNDDVVSLTSNDQGEGRDPLSAPGGGPAFRDKTRPGSHLEGGGPEQSPATRCLLGRGLRWVGGELGSGPSPSLYRDVLLCPGTASASGSKARSGAAENGSWTAPDRPSDASRFSGPGLVALRPGGLTRSCWPGTASASSGRGRLPPHSSRHWPRSGKPQPGGGRTPEPFSDAILDLSGASVFLDLPVPVCKTLLRPAPRALGTTKQ